MPRFYIQGFSEKADLVQIQFNLGSKWCLHIFVISAQIPMYVILAPAHTYHLLSWHLIINNIGISLNIISFLSLLTKPTFRKFQQ